MHKLKRRLGADPGKPFEPIEKPHRMRWATFDRKMAELDAADTAANAYLLPIIEAMIKRTGRTPAARA